jgi:hypothetical protein
VLLDKQNMLSIGQALTTAGTPVLSTNTIDLGVAGTMPQGGSPIRDIGRGTEIDILVQVDTTFTSAGAATLFVELVMADDAALTSNLVVLQQTGVIALATLVAGYQFRLRGIPQGVSKRFLGLRYNPTAFDFTAGKITAGIVDARQSNPTV